ncbi:MAG: allophanate hydrolase [Ilumatobacteraceae bacterium]
MSSTSDATHVTGTGQPRTITGLLAAYRSGELVPTEVIEATIARIASAGDPAVWIGGVDDDAIRDQLASSAPGELTGIPFAVKDNIDVAGMPTTAGCPAFEYSPPKSAAAVARLVGAGGVVVGQTNLDPFATGLVGTRSPYGTPINPFDPAIVPGGSSSGSGVAVATGLVPFALGTDTAGSGRIPAALGNIVGCKPTLGLVSTMGVVPACRSLDCVSVFTLTAHDAAIVLGLLDHPDGGDIYARAVAARRQRPPAAATEVVVGVPSDAVLATCDAPIAEAFARQVDELSKLGIRFREVDLDPFFAAGELLYDGPWVAERHAAVGRFIEQHPDDVHPVTRSIISDASRFDASEAFAAEYRRRRLALRAAATWAEVDAIVVPSLPTIPTIADVAADPIATNARLGQFTTFVNLLDLCAVAVPGGMLPSGLPVGFTLIAPALRDLFLLALADQYQQMVDRPLGALDVGLPATRGGAAGPSSLVTGTLVTVPLAVVGAHLSGQPLNDQLVSRGATLGARTTTAPRYRLVALADTVPPKPGLFRVGADDPGGGAIEIEVWNMPVTELGSFVATVPAPLAIGKLELANGTWVSGFVCEPVGLDGADDITHLGGWRAHLASR